MQQDSTRTQHQPGLLSDSEEDEERIENNSEPLLTLRDTTIRDVYRDNFEQEMKTMMKLAETYNCISMVMLVTCRIRSSQVSTTPMNMCDGSTPTKLYAICKAGTRIPRD